MEDSVNKTLICCRVVITTIWDVHDSRHRAIISSNPSHRGMSSQFIVSSQTQ